MNGRVNHRRRVRVDPIVRNKPLLSSGCSELQLQKSQPRHLQREQCSSLLPASQNASHDSTLTSPSTPELQVAIASWPAELVPSTLVAAQKSQLRHLHIPQCEDAKPASQNGSHIAKLESSGTSDEHGGPSLQNAHPLHLHR